MVIVPVMYVWVMRMTMLDRIVMMRMGMRFGGRIVGAMFMMMVCIMNMGM